jgi:putative phosphoesterase
MKVIIASDIHGNLEYTYRLEELINREKIDKLILLGDLLHNYMYYDPEEEKEVANVLNKYTKIIIAVRGNCDRDYETLKLSFSMSNEIDKVDLDSHSFFITHGHLNYKYESYIDDNYTFLGHTHVYNLEGKHINPGSVGLPRNGNEHTCIIYENDVLRLIDLDNFEEIATRVLK